MMNLVDYVRYILRKIPKGEITKWTCSQFLSSAEPYLQLEKIDKVLSKYKSASYDLGPDVRWRLRLLFRFCPEYFDEEIRNVFSTVKYYDPRAFSGEMPADDTRRAKLGLMNDLAERHRECVERLYESIQAVFPGMTPRERSYLNAYKSQLAGDKCALIKCYDKYSAKHNDVSYDTWRKGYQRCNIEALKGKEYRWPSDEFLRFFAEIDVFYYHAGLNPELIKDGRELKFNEVCALWLYATKCYVGDTSALEEAKANRLIEERESSTCKDKNTVLKKIKLLANQNNTPALKYVLKSGNHSAEDDNFLKRAALLDLDYENDGEKNARNERNWKQSLALPTLVPYQKFRRLKTKEVLFDHNNSEIPKGAIVEEIKVSVRPLQPNGEESIFDPMNPTKDQFSHDRDIRIYNFAEPSPATLDKIMRDNAYISKIEFIFPKGKSYIVHAMAIGTSSSKLDIDALIEWFKIFNDKPVASLPPEISEKINGLKKEIAFRLSNHIPC